MELLVGPNDIIDDVNRTTLDWKGFPFYWNKFNFGKRPKACDQKEFCIDPVCISLICSWRAP